MEEINLPNRYSKILVTGGAGFIGSHIVDRLLKEGIEVTVIDNLTTGKLANVNYHQSKENFHFLKGDIRDLDLVKEVIKDTDAVFHEAAVSSISFSIENPILTNSINVTGTLNLLKVCLDSGVKRFIYASSASVYGKAETLPLREDMVPRPISPYAVSKLAAENYVKIFHKVYGLETVCLRYANVYGYGQANSPYSGVINIFIDQILNNQPPIIYGDGEQTRDFVNVKDVVDANILVLRSKNAVGEIFNIGTNTAISINQLAEMLLEIIGKNDLKPVYTNPRIGDIKHGYADISKAKGIFGYYPKIGLREGLAELVELYRRRDKINE